MVTSRRRTIERDAATRPRGVDEDVEDDALGLERFEKRVRLRVVRHVQAKNDTDLAIETLLHQALVDVRRPAAAGDDHVVASARELETQLGADAT